MHNDIADVLNKGQCVLLVLLDLSAAFDTIDHGKLLHRLKTCGTTGLALSWFESYLSDHVQTVKIDGVESTEQTLHCGAPQWSVLGPLLFTIYITPLGNLIRHHDLNHHQYADNNQMFLIFHLKVIQSAYHRMEKCCFNVKE